MVVGLETPLKADFDIACEKAMHLGVPKNIFTVEPPMKPKMCLSGEDGQGVADFFEESGPSKV